MRFDAVFPHGIPAEPTLLEDIVTGHLTGQQSVIMRELLCDGFASHDRLTEQLWGGREDGGALCPRKHIAVQVWCIRKVLRPDWRIKGLHSRGYELRRTEWPKNTSTARRS